MPELITLEQAAQLTGEPAPSIRRRCNSGKYPGAVRQALGKRMVWMVPTPITDQPRQDYEYYFAAWMGELRSGKGMTRRNPASPATVEYYKYGLKYLWKYTGLTPKLENFTPKAVEQAILSVPFRPDDEYDGYSQKNLIYNASRSFLKYLIREGLGYPQDLDAMKRFKPSRKFNPKQPVVRQDDFDALVAFNDTWRTGMELETQALKVVLYLMGRAALRRAEVAGLKLEDVDLRRCELSVVGKGGKRREVGISPCLVEQIRLWLKAYRPKTKDPHLLVSREGHGLTFSAIQCKIKRLAKASKIDCTPHAFRRYCASWHAQNGTPIAFIQANLGHEHITTTERYIQIDKQAALDAFKQGFTDKTDKSPPVDKKPRLW